MQCKCGWIFHPLHAIIISLLQIYFSGFSVQEVTKLNKIASLCGATRFEEIDENVTHVIVGKRDEKELKLFQDMNKG